MLLQSRLVLTLPALPQGKSGVAAVKVNNPRIIAINSTGRGRLISGAFCMRKILCIHRGACTSRIYNGLQLIQGWSDFVNPNVFVLLLGFLRHRQPTCCVGARIEVAYTRQPAKAPYFDQCNKHFCAAQARVNLFLTERSLLLLLHEQCTLP